MNKALRTLPEQHFTADQHAVTRDALIGMVNASSPAPPRRRLRRVTVVSGIAALALAGGGTAVAFRVFGSAPVTNHDTARCYSKASTDFGTSFPGTTIAALKPNGGGGDQVVAPISMCAQAWEVGLLWGKASDPTPRTYPVPHLVGCVLPDGTAAVFPGPDGLCQDLGLATALSG